MEYLENPLVLRCSDFQPVFRLPPYCQYEEIPHSNSFRGILLDPHMAGTEAFPTQNYYPNFGRDRFPFNLSYILSGDPSSKTD